MKCLVVDHSATMRRVVANALRELGVEVVEASDGKGAFERCDADTTALVTAWNMPGITGIELVRQLRAHPETAGVRVLMVTTRNLRQDVQVALQAGVNGYLLKPFSHDTLRAKLDELLRRGDEERAQAA